MRGAGGAGVAAAILALVMCYELIEMIVEKNNMHDFDSSMFFRWMFKSAFAILIVTNTWNIVMGVFDATQAVVNQSNGHRAVAGLMVPDPCCGADDEHSIHLHFPCDLREND